jgi:ABC-type uncharacterized transport system substrate-binding protein
MNRRAFVTGLGIVVTAPIAAMAQQPEKVRRIGFIEAGSSSVNGHFLDAFRQGLRDLGYIEGRQLIIDDRWAEGRSELYPDLLTDVIRLNADVIVVSTSAGTLAAKKATQIIPIVFVAISDPVSLGFVDSLSRPGGNITGFTSLAAEVGAKWVQLLKEIVPKASRLALLWNPETLPAPLLKGIQDAAKVRRVTLESFEVTDPSDLDRAFGAMTRSHVGGLIVYPDAVTVRHRARIVDLASKTQLPAIYMYPEFVQIGGLMAYGPSLPDLFRRSASFVDKILKGAKPADLPVEQPTKFELVINMKTAKALGLTIPPSLLLRADQVIDQ